MTDVKINEPFILAHSNSEIPEIYRIKAVDVEKNKVNVEVQRVFNDETWVTRREWRWKDTFEDFRYGRFQYL